MAFDSSELLAGSVKKKEPKNVIQATPAYQATTIIRVGAEEASRLSVGTNAEFNISGTIKSIRETSESDSIKRKYEIELEGPKVSSVNMTPADAELKRMVEG